MSAQDRLDDSLRNLADHGQRTPCWHDPDLWFGEHVDDRLRAAELCQRCPLLAECAAVAADLPGRLRTGVWAGVDLTGIARRRQHHQIEKESLRAPRADVGDEQITREARGVGPR